jgi:hypothetical protein
VRFWAGLKGRKKSDPDCALPLTAPSMPLLSLVGSRRSSNAYLCESSGNLSDNHIADVGEGCAGSLSRTREFARARSPPRRFNFDARHSSAPAFCASRTVIVRNIRRSPEERAMSED